MRAQPGCWPDLETARVQGGSMAPFGDGSRALPGWAGQGALRAAPVPGIGHLAGDRLRLGWDIGPQVGWARWGPWPGRVGLWRAGDRPCCGITGVGAGGPEGLTQGPGHGQDDGSPGGEQAGTIRPSGASGAMTGAWRGGNLTCNCLQTS